MKLCWKCRGFIVNSSYIIPPYTHCHHDEPEEKPKPLVCCICGRPATSMNVNIKKLFCEGHSASDLKPKCICNLDKRIIWRLDFDIGAEVQTADYCPKCGRRLN